MDVLPRGRVEPVRTLGGALNYAAILRRYGPSVRRYIRRSVGDENECEDVTQEVYVRLVQVARAGRIASPAHVKHLLFRLARQRVVDYLRRKGRRPAVLGELDGEVEDWLAVAGAGEEPPPLSRLGYTADDVRRAIQRLRSSYHQLLVWKYFEGRSIAAIAAATNRTAMSVNCELYRARRALERQLRAGQGPAAA